MDLTADQFYELLLLMAELCVLGGAAGGVRMVVTWDVASCIAAYFGRREEQRLRIAAARMRNVHSPALFPGFSRRSRAAMIRVLRNRADGVYG